MNAAFRPGVGVPAVTRLRLGRLLFVLLVVASVLVGGAYWLLSSGKPTLPAAITDSTAWPPWLRQAQTYPAPETKPPAQATAAEVDKTAIEWFMATFGDGLKRDTVCSVCTPRRAG